MQVIRSDLIFYLLIPGLQAGLAPWKQGAFWLVTQERQELLHLAVLEPIAASCCRPCSKRGEGCLWHLILYTQDLQMRSMLP